MTGRANDIQTFLIDAGWADATRAPLAGDASNRRYERLRRGHQKAVLMDAPPDKGEDVRPFIAIARHLANVGLAPPDIMAADEEKGLLLIEDLGDALFSRVVEAKPEAETDLYLAATDALVALHNAAPPSAPDYGADTMCDVAMLAPDWYRFGALGAHDPDTRAQLHTSLTQAFADLAPWRPVLVLRDYHAENLLWLPDRPAPQNVGLLDFQDAGLGHPAYDLMSLAVDARRDVSPDTRDAMIAHYAARTEQDQTEFAQACATLSAQRNLRILGVFARLSMHFGKPHYIELIPRVWANLQNDLTHPALTELAQITNRTLPTPTQDILDTLKAKCATIPTL